MEIKKTRQALVEEKKCVYCKGKFLRKVKRKAAGNHACRDGVRKTGSLTCSRECSREYNRERIRELSRKK